MPKRGLTNKTTTISLSLRGMALLSRLAKERGMDSSDLIEMLLREDADKLGIRWQEQTIEEIEEGGYAEVFSRPTDK